MKTAMTAFAAPILCGLLASLSTTSAQTSTLTLPFDDVDYVVDTFDDGDDTTYEVTFTDFGFESVYEFDHDGVVTAITADNERYRFLYRNNGRLRKVKLVSSRRQLSVKGEGDAGMDVALETPASGRGLEKGTTSGKRRLNDECADCEYTWDTLCDQGVETVCDLEGYGDPLSSMAETSIEVFCSSFGSLCDDNTADDVCEEECGEDECLAPLTITLEHTGGSGEDETLVDLFVVQPGGAVAYDGNMATETGELNAEGNEMTYTMFEGLEEDDVTGDYLAFARWHTGGGFVSYTMTATTGSGDVLFSQDGEFNACGDGSSSATEDGFVVQGTTVMLPFTLNEYVDNGC